MKRSTLLTHIGIWGVLGSLTFPVSGLAGTQPIPGTNGHDLQSQVKGTAAKSHSGGGEHRVNRDGARPGVQR